MPPKIRKVVVRQPGVLGCGRQYLMANFDAQPEASNSGSCKNGHVLLIYVQNAKSIVKTIDIVNERFAFKPTYSNVQNLVYRTDKYKNLHREADAQKFNDICEEVFMVRCNPHPSATSQSSDSEMTPTVSGPLHSAMTTIIGSEPVHSSLFGMTTIARSEQIQLPSYAMTISPEHPTNYSLRSDVVTPRKALLRKRLLFVSKTRNDIHRQYQGSLKKLRKTLQSLPYRNRVLKQKVERKDATIKMLRATLRAVKSERGLNTAFHIKQLKQGNEKLKMARKSRCVQVHKTEIYRDLTNLLTQKDEIIRALENEKLMLEDKMEQLSAATSQVSSKKDRKTYSVDIRMMVYDSVINKVPTKNIPILIRKFAESTGVKLNEVPHHSTVEQMTRELGIIADLQTAKLAMESEHLTLAFDATTQGVHINCIHYII